MGAKASNTSTPNPFLYIGKEQDKNTGYYQYGYRQYDATIGRWHVADALAEKYFDSSPYAYVLGNPVNYLDVLGLTAAVGYSTSEHSEMERLIEYLQGGGSLGNYNFGSSWSALYPGGSENEFIKFTSGGGSFGNDSQGSPIVDGSDCNGMYWTDWETIEIPSSLKFKYDNEFTWEDMLFTKYNSSAYNKYEYSPEELEQNAWNVTVGALAVVTGAAAIDMGAVSLVRFAAPKLILLFYIKLYFKQCFITQQI